MMVLVTQADSSEDSQGRQLRVSKKLSKAISSVPRSRFQKPRPNLPGSKRSDSNVPANVSKSLEAIEKSDDASTVIKNSIEAIEKSGDAVIKNGIDVIQKSDDTSTAIQNGVDVIQKSDDTRAAIQNGVENFQKADDNNISILNTNENFQEADDNNIAILNTNEADLKATHNIGILKRFETPEKQDDIYKTATLPVSDENFQKEDDRNSPILCTESVSPQKDCNTPISSTKVICKETPQNKDVRNAISLETSVNLPEQEKNNTVVNTAPSVTDKSSKYPHLTSILSKKRTEPKKEVQHKKRKKFKKGDVAPERSKMTMADLIYWNPTNTDQSPKTIAETVDEVSSSNIEVEEDCADDVEENTLQDSVPKLVISEDGSINIDQSSLYVSRNVPQPTTTEVVRKDETTYSSFRKRPITKHWSKKDTAKFYKALSLVGTDFSLMEQIFPHRTRRELKQKFKREEKFHIDLINRVLYESHTFDDVNLNDFMNQEDTCDVTDDSNSANAQEDTQASVKKKKSRKQKTEKSKTDDPEFCDPDFCDPADECPPDEAVITKDTNKRKRKNKKMSDSDDMIICEKITCIGERQESSKRKRNPKKLPDDFISIDDIEEIGLSNDEETNDSFKEVEHEEKNQDDDAHITYTEENVDSVSEVAVQSLPLNSNEEEEYVTIEYVENIDSETNLTLLSNVMAYEVVTSQEPVPKKRRKVTSSVIPRKPVVPFLPLRLSATNYTPV